MDDQQQPQSSVTDLTHEHNIFKTDPIDFNCKIEEEFSMARKPVTDPDNPTAISAQSYLGIQYAAEGPTFNQMDTYSEENSVHTDNQPVSVVGEQRLLMSNKRRSSQKDIGAAELSVSTMQGPKVTRNVHGNKRKHQCPHCSAAYREACHLKVHIRTHTGEKPFVCKLCSKTFHAADHLKHHMQTHNKDQNQCPYCPGQFAQPFQLENHIRTHTGEKPFLCKVCNKAFHVARYLTLHMQIHDKDQHKCPHCPDKFALLYRLKDHIRTHTGEKPFLCKVCGKTFHSARYLREHMQIHDKHQCPHCPKKFAQQFHLKNHIRTHTGEKPFICKICSKAFHAARILRGHMQIHDKDQH
ncbi:gastrula zinc finger protein XlCGF8.2DB-like [Anopheles cruzii]|uniref:gastrula zinc finger protein XlCGF8.2DB-like n=1 Tax=Anopheles cruzii TaxID=68878 RepID=UPI0022EC18A2|nr:gastrula zinc finger protein XlCGF8.2DB-like [Anopheles cruzii]